MKELSDGNSFSIFLHNSFFTPLPRLPTKEHRHWFLIHYQIPGFSNKYYVMICGVYIPQQLYGAMINVGICRVHGGGFAGTIQAFVKKEEVKFYQEYMNNIFGEGACIIVAYHL